MGWITVISGGIVVQAETLWIAISSCALPFTMLFSMILVDTDEEWSSIDFWWLWLGFQVLVMVVTAILVRW